MEVIFLTFTASLAALAGGYIAIRSSDWLNYAMALTSGLVLGLVTFDLLPEIFDIVKRQNLNFIYPMIAMTLGFLAFHALELFLPIHSDNEDQHAAIRNPRLGTARAVALSGHSFLDGLSIGVAFQVSSAVGAAVALAVIGHRFADGFDTTTFMVFHKNKLVHIKRWLAVVIIMPVIGGLASLVWSFSESALAVYLAFFAGFILYIAAGNMLHQSHSRWSNRKSFALAVVGTIFMFIVTRFV